MVFAAIFILTGFVMILQTGQVAGLNLRELITRYFDHAENEVAFELIGRYKQANSHEQGEIIYGLLAPHQHDLSRIITGLNEDPQEELQKLFLKVHGLFMREKFPHSNWKYWLARILKNELLSQKKSQKTYTGLPVDILELVEEQNDNEQYFSKLQEAIQQLSENQQQVVRLRYGNTTGKLMTYKDIATKMNCSTGQVHGYLDRAKENLRNHLNELVES